MTNQQRDTARIRSVINSIKDYKIRLETAFLIVCDFRDQNSMEDFEALLAEGRDISPSLSERWLNIYKLECGNIIKGERK